MTKRDLKSLATAGTLGLAGFFTFWFFFRRTVKVPTLDPVQVKWERP